MLASQPVVAARARLLARIKLIFDLLLGVALYLSGAPLLYLLAPGLDVILLFPYQRFVSRAPAILTLATLTLSAVLLALGPTALGAAGIALWVLYPLVPLGAGFVLGRRRQLWQMAAITVGIAAVAAYQLLASPQPILMDQVPLGAFVLAIVASIATTAWLTARTLRPDPGSRDILGAALPVVKGVVIVPFNWVIGGIQGDALRLELHQVQRRHNTRWIVLDLGPAGELGRHDLNAIEDAAEAVSTPRCTVVLARPPVDALSLLDFAQPTLDRTERFATVPQAVEAGLRRVGWTQREDQAQRVETLL